MVPRDGANNEDASQLHKQKVKGATVARSPQYGGMFAKRYMQPKWLPKEPPLAEGCGDALFWWMLWGCAGDVLR